MTATIDSPQDTINKKAGTFESLNPATGEVIATHPIHDRDDVLAAVERARSVSDWWQAIGFDGRKEYLNKWRVVLTSRLAELSDLMHREGGKPFGDAQMEAGLAIDHLAWAAKNAKKVLGRSIVNPGMLMTNQLATVEYKPLGVVGVIGPWNYPVFTPMGSIAYALAAGNTVVFKPSEYTPTVGKFLVDTFADVLDDRPVLQLITGMGETGGHLTSAGADKIAFTGSTATGKKVMAACAETLTPVIVEAGGKDSLIVDEDADLGAAAEAALWCSMSNAGQTCIGTERVYVHEKVHDEFIEELLSRARQVRPGFDDGGNYGPATMPSQLGIIKSHIEAAIADGGKVLLGGDDAVGARFVQPTIIAGVPEDSIAMTEETFGPTLIVNKVADMDEAVRLTNATRYGLANAVFGKRNATDVARRVRSGMTSINSVLSYAGVPSLPFGGVGDSGFGRIHGPDGLREFTYAKSITKQVMPSPVALQTFAKSKGTDKRFAQIIRLLHGGVGPLRRK